MLSAWTQSGFRRDKTCSKSWVYRQNCGYCTSLFSHSSSAYEYIINHYDDSHNFLHACLPVNIKIPSSTYKPLLLPEQKIKCLKNYHVLKGVQNPIALYGSMNLHSLCNLMKPLGWFEKYFPLISTS